MNYNNAAQPKGTARSGRPSVYIEDLNSKQKEQLIGLASDIEKNTLQHLTDNYDVATECEETAEGIVVSVGVFYFDNLVGSLQMEINSVTESVEDRKEQARETSKALVSETVGQLIHADDGPVNRKGS